MKQEVFEHRPRVFWQKKKRQSTSRCHWRDLVPFNPYNKQNSLSSQRHVEFCRCSDGARQRRCAQRPARRTRRRLNRALWSQGHGMFQTPLQGRAVKARGSALALGLLLTVLSTQTAAQSGCVWRVPAIDPDCPESPPDDGEHCAQYGLYDPCCICNARPTLSELQSTLPSLCKVTSLEHVTA
jgi:hypothetical protein